VFPLGVATLVLLVVYWTLVPASSRRAVFFATSGVALALYFPAAVVVLTAVSSLVYAALAPAEERVDWTRATAVTAGSVALLALRGAEPVTSLHVVGLSYAVFRLIHVAIERARGRIRLERFVPFLEYAIFPPAFLSGPIERYDAFQNGIDVSSLDLDGAFWGTRRIFFGLAKKVFLVGALHDAAERGFADPSGGASGAWLALLAYSLYVYLDFSAYTDVVLGVARLFGYRLSENFRWPYLAEDIGDFWRRWHVTLSLWLRDYVYLPLSVKLAENRSLRRRPLGIASASAIVTMVACGLWHGNTPALAIWGLGHGLGIAAHQVYRQRIFAKLPARRRKAIAENVVYRAAATSLTFVSVMLLWVYFRFPVVKATSVFARLFGLG